MLQILQVHFAMKVSYDKNAQLRHGTNFNRVSVSAIALGAHKKANSIKLLKSIGNNGTSSAHAALQVFYDAGLSMNDSGPSGDETGEFREAWFGFMM